MYAYDEALLILRVALTMTLNLSCPCLRTFSLGTCKTRENSNFLKNGKIVISVKIRNFFKSRMTKQTSLLESSREIYLTSRISSNFETVEIYTFFEALGVGCCKTGLRDM